MKEPVIHSHIIDELPVKHALAYKTVECKFCARLVHAPTNECLATWVEFGTRQYCLGCFANLAGKSGSLDRLAESTGVL